MSPVLSEPDALWAPLAPVGPWPLRRAERRVVNVLRHDCRAATVAGCFCIPLPRNAIFNAVAAMSTHCHSFGNAADTSERNALIKAFIGFEAGPPPGGGAACVGGGGCPPGGGGAPWPGTTLNGGLAWPWPSCPNVGGSCTLYAPQYTARHGLTNRPFWF